MADHSFDLLVTGGRVVTGRLDAALDVGIRDGRVVALLEPGAVTTAPRTLDAAGLLVLPGGIDTHTHVSWPYGGTVTEDGFTEATRVAALGGTTTLVDFVPPLRSDERLVDACRARIAEADRHAVVDVALHPILNRADDELLADIGTVVELGCTSFKMYTTYEENLVDDGEVWRLTRTIAAHGGLPGFHAENHGVIVEAGREVADAGRLSVADFAASRPAVAEAVAIGAVCRIARHLGTPVYIFHVSGVEALAAIDEARAAGTEVYAETCTHYLAFDDTVFTRDDAWKFLISPAIRGAADREALWRAFADGRVQSVGSDHCAYPAATKSAHPEDHRLTPLGAAGVQSRSPVLWHEAVGVHGLTPSQFVLGSAERAARALGMYPRKGTIGVGSDADLVLLDPETAWSGSDLAPASSDTFDLYDRYAGRGLPRHVLVRGRQVVEDGEPKGQPGDGGYLARRPRTTTEEAR